MNTRFSQRQDYLGQNFDCECGRNHTVPTKAIRIRPNALQDLPEIANTHLPTGTWTIVCDPLTLKAAAEQALDILKQAKLSTNLHVRPNDHPTADIETVQSVKLAVQGSSGLLSVGSGTINDLTKAAADALGVPFISIATAASMNGYTSSIAALLDAGLKTTVPATPAAAVICDLNILSQAPRPMTRSGLGDVVSKPVCNADWRLSNLLLNQHHCPRPFSLIKELEDVYLSRAKNLNQDEPCPDTLSALTEALLYSGVSMCLAGSSAPASGGEHLISHTMDMQALLHGREHDFHGTQVGIATSFMVRLYKNFMNLSASDIPKSSKPVNMSNLESSLRHYWQGRVDPVLTQTHAQFDDQGFGLVKAKDIHNHWNDIQNLLPHYLDGAERIEQALLDAGAKTHYSHLNYSREDFETVIYQAPYIRNRFTLLHLLRDVQLLKDLTQNTLDQMDSDKPQSTSNT